MNERRAREIADRRGGARLTDNEARNLAARAYERISLGAMFSTLPATLQDLLVEIVDTASELQGAFGGYCTECGESVKEGDIHCNDCWLRKHAETCQTCNDKIPMKDQRCWSCVESALRMMLAAEKIPRAQIDRIVKGIEP